MDRLQNLSFRRTVWRGKITPAEGKPVEAAGVLRGILAAKGLQLKGLQDCGSREGLRISQKQPILCQ